MPPALDAAKTKQSFVWCGQGTSHQKKKNRKKNQNFWRPNFATQGMECSSHVFIPQTACKTKTDTWIILSRDKRTDGQERDDTQDSEMAQKSPTRPHTHTHSHSHTKNSTSNSKTTSTLERTAIGRGHHPSRVVNVLPMAPYQAPSPQQKNTMPMSAWRTKW